MIDNIPFATSMASIIELVSYLFKLEQSKTAKVYNELVLAIKDFQNMPDGLMMCFPNHWHDLVAYKTNKKVLFRGHGFCFKLLEPIFPRFLKPVSEIIVDYKVKYIISYEGYLPEHFINEVPVDSLKTFGDYRLYSLK